MRAIATVLLVDTVESTATLSRLGHERSQQIAAREMEASARRSGYSRSWR